MIRRLILACVCVLGWAVSAQAQVTVGTTYSGTTTNTISVTAATVTIAASEVVDVCVAWRAGDDETISSITFNGSATGISNNYNSVGASQRVGLASYRIVGVTGTGDVVVTFNDSVAGARVMVSRLTNVDNGTPAGTSSVVTDLGGETGTLSTSRTLASGDLALTCVVTNQNTQATLAANSGQADIFTALHTGDQTDALSSEGGTGSVTSGYTWNGTVGTWARLGMVPYLVASAATPVCKGALLGVGCEHSSQR